MAMAVAAYSLALPTTNRGNGTGGDDVDGGDGGVDVGEAARGGVGASPAAVAAAAEADCMVTNG